MASLHERLLDDAAEANADAPYSITSPAVGIHSPGRSGRRDGRDGNSAAVASTPQRGRGGYAAGVMATPPRSGGGGMRLSHSPGHVGSLPKLGSSPLRGFGGVGSLLNSPQHHLPATPSSRTRSKASAIQQSQQQHPHAAGSVNPAAVIHTSAYTLHQPASSLHSPPPESWGADDEHVHSSGTALDFGQSVMPSSGSFKIQLPVPAQPGPPMSRALKGYTTGQLLSVVRSGTWWCLFGPLMLSQFDGHVYAPAGTRLAFNLALLFASPLAAILVERVPVKTILIATVSLRALLYCAVMPIIWMLLETPWLVSHDNGSYHEPLSSQYLLVSFIVVVFFDGLVVAASNVVDVDCDGTALIARQSLSTLHPDQQAAVARWHERAFDFSMILLAPAIAVAAQAGCEYWPSSSHPVDLAGPVLLLALASLFAVCSIPAILAYACTLPSLSARGLRRTMQADEVVDETTGAIKFVLQHRRDDSRASLSASLAGLSSPTSPALDHRARTRSLDGTEGDLELSFDDDDEDEVSGGPVLRSKPTLGDEIVSLTRMLVLGAQLCFQDAELRWRLWLLGIQTALEDAAISILIPVICSIVLRHALTDPTQPSPGGPEEAGCFFGKANVLAVGMIALAKFAGLVGSAVRSRGWIAEETLAGWVDLRSSRFVSLSLALSALGLAIFPLPVMLLLEPSLEAFWRSAVPAHTSSRVEVAVTLTVVGTSTALCFLLAALPKFLLATGVQIEAEKIEAAVARAREARLAREAAGLLPDGRGSDRDRSAPVSQASSRAVTPFGDRAGSPGAIEEAARRPELDVQRSLFGFVAAWLTCIDSVCLAMAAAMFGLTSAGNRVRHNQGLLIFCGCIAVHALTVLLAHACSSKQTASLDEQMFDESAEAGVAAVHPASHNASMPGSPLGATTATRQPITPPKPGDSAHTNQQQYVSPPPPQRKYSTDPVASPFRGTAALGPVQSAAEQRAGVVSGVSSAIPSGAASTDPMKNLAYSVTPSSQVHPGMLGSVAAHSSNSNGSDSPASAAGSGGLSLQGAAMSPIASAVAPMGASLENTNGHGSAARNGGSNVLPASNSSGNLGNTASPLSASVSFGGKGSAFSTPRNVRSKTGS